MNVKIAPKIFVKIKAHDIRQAFMKPNWIWTPLWAWFINRLLRRPYNRMERDFIKDRPRINVPEALTQSR